MRSREIVNGSASVTTGVGSVSGSPTFVGNTMIANLTGITNAQRIVITVNGVTDSFGQVFSTGSVTADFLLGDTSGNDNVNTSDIGQTKAQSGITVSASNFREDVTANGTINTSDIGQVKNSSGTSIPNP